MVDADQSRFSGGSALTREELTIEQHSSTHAGPQGEQQDIAVADRSTPPGLTHHGAIPIVGEGHPPAELRLEPFRKGDLLPTRQVDTHPSHPRLRIHRSRQTNAHPRGPSIGIEGSDRIDDCRHHSARHGRLRRGAFQLRQELTGGGEAAQLDGRPSHIHSNQFAHWDGR